MQSTYRIAQQELEIDGEAFAPGDGVHVLLAGAGRDPRVYDEPDVFDIRRVSPPDHLAFSGGMHYCVGAPLARLEGAVALAALSQEMPLLARAGRPTRRPSVSIRGFARFPVSGGARGR